MQELEMNYFQCVAIDTKIYVVGAWYGQYPFEIAHTVTFVYTTISDTWPSMVGLGKRNRGGGATVVYGGHIYQGKAYNPVDLYDPYADSFGPVQWMKQGRHGTGLGVAPCKCGNIYIPSGSGDLGGEPELTSLEFFTPDGTVRSGAQRF